MKKKLAVFLTLVFALSLCCAGCGNSDKVTINVLNWGDYIDEDLIALVNLILLTACFNNCVHFTAPAFFTKLATTGGTLS